MILKCLFKQMDLVSMKINNKIVIIAIKIIRIVIVKMICFLCLQKQMNFNHKKIILLIFLLRHLISFQNNKSFHKIYKKINNKIKFNNRKKKYQKKILNQMNNKFLKKILQCKKKLNNLIKIFKNVYNLKRMIINIKTYNLK